MNNLNSVLLEGNLTRDPELRYTAKGTAVCRFAIACNRSYKQDEQRQEEVSYFDVTTWSRLAEICAEYLVKGRGVRVVGRLKQDRWEDDSGNRRSRIEVIAEHVEFKPQRRDEAETEPEAEAILPEPEPAQATA
jgi:single-strand DNA-binding protein